MNIAIVLVPVDFSTCSLLVTRQAAGLAAKLGARLVVLHVAELPSTVPPHATVRPDGVPRDASEWLLEDTGRLLEPFTAAARESGVEVDTVVKLGPVVQTILASIEETHSDLVVIGTHGRTGVARMMLGSVAEAVAHRAHVPVMLVRRETRPECNRSNCEWCPHSGRSPAEDALRSESQG
jgi:nucleotide-binding universal stress UspA family protein